MLYSPRDMRVVQVDRPTVGPKEVLIKVNAVGICGTDVSMYEGTYPELDLPLVIGHEFAGEVAEIGSEVKGVQVGNKAMGEPSWGCASCEFCRAGEENLCSNAVHLGRNAPGAFAEYVVVPWKVAHALPEGVSYDEGQEVVSLACAVRAAKRSGIAFGKTAAVLGAGHFGLLLTQVLRAIGASPIMVFGRRKSRLNLAKTLGADLALDVDETDPVKSVLDSTSGGVDYVFEASGNATAVKQAAAMVKKGGTVTVAGIHKNQMDGFRVSDFYFKELTMLGSRGGIGGYSTAVQLLSSDRIKVEPIITHRLPLDRINQAFESVHQEDYIRGVVQT